MEPALHPWRHRVHPVRRVPVLEQALKEHAGEPMSEEEHVEHAEPPWLTSILLVAGHRMVTRDALRHFDANERRSRAGLNCPLARPVPTFPGWGAGRSLARWAVRTRRC